MVRKLVVVFTSVLLFAAAHVKALGLGEVVVESALNQPLAARIDLLQLGGVRPDQINVQLASERDFARFSIDRESFLDSIRFNVESTGNTAYVRLTTSGAVREPYLSFVLETSWPSGRLLSEHTVLLDLPSFAASGQAAPIHQAAQIPAPETPQNTAENQTDTSLSSDVSANQPVRLAAPAEPEPVADPVPTSAPQNPVSQVVEQPAQTPLAATSDTVSIGADDTLWDIALQIRPDSSVSVQQTMLALQRLNSEAFIADNINMVRRGQVLRVPDIEQIRALSAREAISEVARQNQLFENRRNVPLTAQPVSAQPPAAPAGSGPNRAELSVVTTDSADSGAAQSTSGGRSAELDARIASLENELAVQQEEADRVALQNRELTERLGLLEQQIASAQEIIRLRDLELAQLQQALVQAEAAASVPVDPPTVITMAPERSFLQTILDTLIANTYALLAVTALVILMLVYVLLRRNRASEEDALVEMDGMVEPANAIAATGASAGFSANQSSVMRNTNDDADLDEIFDLAEEADDVMNAEELVSDDADVLSEVLEEADALIAHQHYGEATDLLEDAVMTEPERTDLRLKLLEVYVARQDIAAFNSQAALLRNLGGAGVAARVAELRSQLRNEFEEEILEEGEDDFFSELNALGDKDLVDDPDDSKAVVSAVAAGLAGVTVADRIIDDAEEDDTSVAQENEQAIDFDFSLTEPDASTVQPAVQAVEDDEGTEENLLDFDFGFAVEDSAATETEEDISEPEVVEEDPEHSVDFDFAVLDDEAGQLATVEVDEDEFSFDSSEFDLDIAAVDPQSHSDRADLAFPDDDALADLRFVDDDALEDAAAQNAEDATGDDEFEFLSDTDEVATKLDLAQAYYEMGDYEGAREILEEVIDEGTDAQIKDARVLLDKL